MSTEAPEEGTSQEQELVDAPTRPTNVGRHVNKTRKERRVQRFTVDLEREQHTFLRFFAINNEVKASVIFRTLLFMLETDREFAQRVIDEIFDASENSEN